MDSKETSHRRRVVLVTRLFLAECVALTKMEEVPDYVAAAECWIAGKFISIQDGLSNHAVLCAPILLQRLAEAGMRDKGRRKLQPPIHRMRLLYHTIGRPAQTASHLTLPRRSICPK